MTTHTKKNPKRSVLNRALKAYFKSRAPETNEYWPSSLTDPPKGSYLKCCESFLKRADYWTSTSGFVFSKPLDLMKHQASIQHIARKYDIRQRDLKDMVMMKKLLNKLKR